MNKQQIVEILQKYADNFPIYDYDPDRIGAIADEIMALRDKPVCPKCNFKFPWPYEKIAVLDEVNPDTYNKLSELDSEKFPVRVEERPGGKTIYPVDIADATWPTTDPFKITIISPEVFAGKKLSEILVHEDDCECRQCRPDLWFQQDDVWTKKI